MVAQYISVNRLIYKYINYHIVSTGYDLSFWLFAKVQRQVLSNMSQSEDRRQETENSDMD